MSVRIDVEDLARLERIAAGRFQSSLSDVLRDAVRLYLAQAEALDVFGEHDR